MTKLKIRLGQMAVVAMLATGLLVIAQIDSADATFTAKNGVIAFESNRSTGKDVNNPTGDTEIFTAEPDGSGLEQLTHNTAEDFSPAFSPDGRRLAFTTSRRGDYFEIFTMNADGSNPRNLTRNQVDDSDPDYSPDGRHIAFTTSRDGNEEVYKMKVDGSVARNVTQKPSNPDQNPSWQPIH